MTPDRFRHLQYRVEAGVAVISLDRPDRRNAWSGPMRSSTGGPSTTLITTRRLGWRSSPEQAVDFCVGADREALLDIGGANGAYAREVAALPGYPEGTPDWLRHNHCAALAISTR